MALWRHKLETLTNDRWLVFVCAMWIQSVAGVGYLFGGSMSPAIKTSLGYNQKQIGLLGVAKNLGDAIGFVSGALSDVSPSWTVLLVGAAQNFVGYGVVWLVVTGQLPNLPLWILFVAIFVGTNGETYYNTASLVSCIHNFPESRGPVVGILKGFSGLSGAILTQVYLMFNPSHDSSVILMVALGPPLVVLALLFVVRPVERSCRASSRSDDLRFLAIYGFCVVLAVYLLGVLVLRSLVDITQTVTTASGAILVVLMVAPVLVPFASVFLSGNNAALAKTEEGTSSVDPNEVKTLIERSDISPGKRRAPCIGEDFTLLQALGQFDFWLIFMSLVLGVGSGITVIDNLGQICYSLGYSNAKVFVSLISISNFLGRVAGGYFSELIIRKLSLPRTMAMSAVQAIMSLGLIYYAIDWPGKIYVVTIVIGMDQMNDVIRAEQQKDVYSFGELVLEILSNGKLRDAGRLVHNKPKDVLLREVYAENENGFEQQVKRVVEVALLCISSNQCDRPCMEDAFRFLSEPHSSSRLQTVLNYT
ncbi:BnaA02g11610D [Brassica napus]|uniref:BnaA02g11610D protein n=1 Tax=Brassica napus TaxID=3708 RepID=A0A078FU41_BRANA|nr:BnaA02g11610D [Brassica napus]